MQCREMSYNFQTKLNLIKLIQDQKLSVSTASLTDVLVKAPVGLHLYIFKNDW